MPKRPRGRPRAFDRDAALGAVSARFRSQGYSGTSLEELAEAAGINRPSLNAAFGDKRALYLAALGRTEAWLEQSFGSLIAARLPLREALERMFRFSISVYLSGTTGPEGCIVLNTAAAEAPGDPQIRAALARILALEDRAIETILEQGGSPSPKAHAALAAALLHSLSIRARAGEPRETLEAIAADCVALIVGRSGTSG